MFDTLDANMNEKHLNKIADELKRRILSHFSLIFPGQRSILKIIPRLTPFLT